MSLEFFGHPFSSYTQKVLIALWADETPFDYRMVDRHPDNMEELKRHSPFGHVPAAGRRWRPRGVRDLDRSSSICRRIIRAQPLDPGRRRRAGGCASSTASSTFMSWATCRSRCSTCLAARRHADPYGVEQGARAAAHRLRLARGESRRRAVGGRATASPWPIAPRRRRSSTPTGSRRSAPNGRASRPIARGCWPIPSSRGRSMKAGPTGIISRWARPTAIKRRRARPSVFARRR